MPKSNENENKYAPTVWGKGSGGSSDGPVEVKCPSGQMCLAQRPGLEGMIKAGLLKDFNALAGIVGVKIDAKKNPAKALKAAQGKISAEKLFENPEMLDNMLHMVNKITCHVVVEPEVHMPPNDVTNRKRDLIYADDIDLNDRMFLFNWAMGGSNDLDSFRAGLNANVADMADVQGVAKAAE